MYLVDSGTGVQINPGAQVADWQGQSWIFDRISRAPETGKSGKIILRSGATTREFYPGVIGAAIVSEPSDAATGHTYAIHYDANMPALLRWVVFQDGRAFAAFAQQEDAFAYAQIKNPPDVPTLTYGG